MASRSTPVNGVGYDKSLLADAPEVTKADKQEGYNVDLLEQGRPSPRPGTVPPGGTRAPAPGGPNKYAGGGGGSEESSGLHKGAALPITTKTGGKPARSKKIVIAIAAVVLLICIAVGVGAGVGVSKSRHNNNNTSNPPADPNASTDTSKPSGSIPVSTETSKPVGGGVVTSSTSSSSDENAGGGGVGDIETSRPLIVPTAINTKAGDVKWVF